MDTRATLTITMSVEELGNLIERRLDEVLNRRFTPLRRQFEDRLIPMSEAAKKLGVSVRTLSNLEQRKELIPSRIGKRVMYSESSITQYLNRNEATM